MIDLHMTYEHIQATKAQVHMCICNTNLFPDSVSKGVYGFPHAGSVGTKSFWRSMASLYNIGRNDLIFLYRTNGIDPGCKEINGPFKIHNQNGIPALFYDELRGREPIYIQTGRTERDRTYCNSRFLFTNTENKYYSIADNYEVVKKYESKEIWGYRHPAVMNIGSARKKSITSFTYKQAMTMLRLFEDFGVERGAINDQIPNQSIRDYYDELIQSDTGFHVNEEYLLGNVNSNDEAYLYCYLIHCLKNRESEISRSMLNRFSEINNPMYEEHGYVCFEEASHNVLLEAIISPHLQDELDIVITDENDGGLTYFEIKAGLIDELAIQQTIRYLTLLSAVFSGKKVFANIIGNGLSVSDYRPISNIRCIVYSKTADGTIAFTEQ